MRKIEVFLVKYLIGIKKTKPKNLNLNLKNFKRKE